MTPTGPTLSPLQPGRSVTPLASTRAGQKTAVVAVEPATTAVAIETVQQPTRRGALTGNNTNADPWQRNLTAQARSALHAYSQWAAPLDDAAAATLAGVDIYV